MFDNETLNELAPVQIERQALNLGVWRAEVRQLKGQRVTAGVDLGRKFREAYAALPRKDAVLEIERAGFSILSAAALLLQANDADGIARPPFKPRQKRGFDKADAREMLAALKAGEVDAVILSLEEVLRG